MKFKRHDRLTLDAKRASENKDGFLFDNQAILTRTGVFTYINPDGSLRRELRLPEEVFKADSMASLIGKPITNNHPNGKVNATNARDLTVGSVLSQVKQDGDNLVADIVIHDPSFVKAGNIELSCGYECTLEEKSGEYNGERYDFIQRNIEYNHLAIVPKGRAGNAKLNLDSDGHQTSDFFSSQDNPSDPAPNPKFNFNKDNQNMKKIRLDNGLDYEAAPEVVAEFEKNKQRLDALEKEKAKLEAERDAAKDDLKKAQETQETAIAQAKADALERLKLEETAKEHGVDFKADADDLDIKKAIVQKLRGDSINFDCKSNDYINAMFDIAITEQPSDSKQRQSLHGDGADDDTKNQNQDGKPKNSTQARQNMIEMYKNQGKKK